VPACLSSKDYRFLLKVIEIAHFIPDRLEMLTSVFEKIEKWVGFSTGVFIASCLGTRMPDIGKAFAYRGSPEALRLYCSYYWRTHPQARLLQELPLSCHNRSLRLSDTFPMSRLGDTEYGRDFQTKASIFYELGGILVCEGDLIATVRLARQRCERNFTSRHVAFMDHFLPHLSQALYNIELREGATVSEEVGMVLIGLKGHVELQNDVAKRALNGRPAISIPDSGPTSNPPILRTETGSYRVRTRLICPGRKRLILLEPLPSRGHLRTKLDGFGLTLRQEEVASMVMSGLGNREIAEKLFVTEQTVKDHLRDVFKKMQVHRRSELVAKILGLRDQSDTNLHV